MPFFKIISEEELEIGDNGVDVICRKEYPDRTYVYSKSKKIIRNNIKTKGKIEIHKMPSLKWMLFQTSGCELEHPQSDL